MILPDTNIWIYNFDEELEPEHELVRAWLSEWMPKSNVLVPAIVETEVIHYLARQLDRELAGTVIRRFLAHPGQTVALESSVNREVGDLLLSQPDRGISGRDASILVAAKRHDATLITHDPGLFDTARDWGLDAHDPAAEG